MFKKEFMPKSKTDRLANQGFALLPILIVLLCLSVITFAGVSYYNKSSTPDRLSLNSKEFSEEDVLQATAGVTDLNSFFFTQTFGVKN